MTNELLRKRAGIHHGLLRRTTNVSCGSKTEVVLFEPHVRSTSGSRNRPGLAVAERDYGLRFVIEATVLLSPFFADDETRRLSEAIRML